MATRDTLEKAQELKARWEVDFPNAEIRIINKSGIMTVGRGVAEMENLEIIEDNGGIMVKVQMPQFEVLEVRHCECGAEILTAAVGEWGLNECQNCKQTREVEYAANLQAGIEKSRQEVNEIAWRDEWEES
jgi:hypothetical protein